MIFNYQFHEAMKTKTLIYLTPFLGDITQFLGAATQMGCRFTNPSVSRGRSFCGSSNTLVGSMLVMFLMASRWQIGAYAFHIQPAKPTLRPSTKLAFLPTFVLQVAPPHVRRDALAGTVCRAATGQAHYSLQGRHQ